MAIASLKNLVVVEADSPQAGFDAAATSINLKAGHLAKLPTPPFFLVVWNSTDYSTPLEDPDAEIIFVVATASAPERLSEVRRGQDGTTAKAHNTAGKTYRFTLPANALLLEHLGGRHAFNVKLFGAKGDAIADDTEFIQAAIDRAVLSTGSTVVYFPRGIYKFTQLSIPSVGITLIGDGPDQTVLLQNGAAATTDAIITDSSAGSQDGAIMRDLAIQGQSNGGHVIHLRQMKGGEFSNLFVLGPGTDKACIRVRDNCQKLEFRNIRLAGGYSNTGIKGFWIGDAGDGGSPLTTNIWLDGVWSKAIGSTDKLTGAVFHLDHTAGIRVQNVKIEGAKCSIACCWIEAGRHNKFYNVGFESAAPGDSAVDFLLDGTQRNYFEDCGISNEATTGFKLQNTTTKTVWKGGLVAGPIDIDTSSRFTFFEDFDELPGFSVTWSGASPAIARQTTRIGHSAKYNSSNAFQVSYTSGEDEEVREFNEILTVQNAANQAVSSRDSGFFYYRLPYDAMIVGIQVEVSSPRTVGTLTAKVKLNGVVKTAVTAQLNGSNTEFRRAITTTDLTDFGLDRGDKLEAVYDSSSDWQTTAGFGSTSIRIVITIRRVGRID